jgi:hypothetical protein
MPLAKRVRFWDAGPEAIGEDLHMTLKCMLKTGMRAIFHPIYLPASCSNVQTDGYWSNINARFQQSKRHLWGILDFGFACAGVILNKSLIGKSSLFNLLWLAMKSGGMRWDMMTGLDGRRG